MTDWFRREINEQRVYRFDLGIYVFSILNTLIFLLLTAYKLWCGAPQKNIYKSIRFLSTIHCVFYLAYFISFYPDTDVEHTDLNRSISYYCIFLAQISFYSLMTVRLYQTFHSTIYALSRRTIYFFTVLGSLLSISWIVWFSQPLYFDVHDIDYFFDDDNPRYFRLFNYAVLSLIFFSSCCYGFWLIILFVSKLFKLTLSQRQSMHIFNEKRITTSLSYTASSHYHSNLRRTETKTPRDTHECMDVELTDKQRSLLSTMAKNSILSICAIVLYQSLLLIGTVVTTDYRIEVIYKFVFALAIFFEMLCIYLSFKTNERLYRCLCGACHRCCQRCCEKCVESKIKKLNEQQLHFYDTSNALVEEVSLTEASLSHYLNEKV